MTIPVYLCDDVPELLDQYVRLISNTILIEEYPMEIAGAFTKPDELLETANKQVKSGNMCGIYFLDISLNDDMDGLGLAKEIRKIDSRAFIIFITTHGNLAAETFKQQLEAMDFIVKDDIKNIHKRITDCLKSAYERKLTEKNRPVICIRSGHNLLYYNADDIICICASKTPHYCDIITIKDKKSLRISLSDIYNTLGPDFIFCHRSAIINKLHITNVDYCGRLIHMSNSLTLKASKEGLMNLSPSPL